VLLLQLKGNRGRVAPEAGYDQRPKERRLSAVGTGCSIPPGVPDLFAWQILLKAPQPLLAISAAELRCRQESEI